jgi:hypothetical protein
MSHLSERQVEGFDPGCQGQGSTALLGQRLGDMPLVWKTWDTFCIEEMRRVWRHWPSHPLLRELRFLNEPEDSHANQVN